MKRWIKNNSLSLVMFGLFLAIIAGQSLVGYRHYNNEQEEHQQSAITYIDYVRGGEFIEATFENWESEFLQMWAFVILTVFLRQKGSAESKKLRGAEPVDVEPEPRGRNKPWPVRKGGLTLKIYEHSLSISFLLLFILSISLHAYGGARATCEENIAHGQMTCESTIQYMSTSKFWFESFQNWQSEFLALGAIVVLTIFLREKGSPESKPVATPHYQTGNE